MDKKLQAAILVPNEDGTYTCKQNGKIYESPAAFANSEDVAGGASVVIARRKADAESHAREQ